MSRLSSSESSSDTETDSTSDRQENRRDSILSTGSNSQSDLLRKDEIDFGKGNPHLNKIAKPKKIFNPETFLTLYFTSLQR